VDFVQVDYSIANRDAAMSVFPVALERRIAVIANVPFGGRSGANLTQSQNRPLPPFAAEFGASDWPQLLLKYVVSHPAVTCTIAGSTKVEHLEDNQAAARGVLLDAAGRRRIEQYWDDHA
jgi:aryl-alcohol dehydrogenase-like predicted oxidoreductase